jgi:hypothetical protein
VELRENILNVLANIPGRQLIPGGEGAYYLIKRIPAIAQLPDLSGRFIDDMGAAIAAIMEDGFLPDTLERDVFARGW